MTIKGFFLFPFLGVYVEEGAINGFSPLEKATISTLEDGKLKNCYTICSTDEASLLPPPPSAAVVRSFDVATNSQRMATTLGYPFTWAQWKELERQAMIYKYMVSAMSVLSLELHILYRLLDQYKADTQQI